MAIFLVAISCVEPFEAETRGFENVLVVDARLTNEEKQHDIILARSYPFEEETFVPESNASIQIIDQMGNVYVFEEEAPGLYRSILKFAAQPNMGYELSITSDEGISYISETVVTPTSILIDEVKAEIHFNDSNEEGLQISLTNESGIIEPKYFRYEYEETYKIIAPHYNPAEFDVVDSLFFAPDDNDGYEINIVARTEEARTCYNKNASTDIALSDSERNIGGQTGKTQIRFINSNDFMISHRYSILVKQFALTQEAHSYYRNLDDFSRSESVFSDTQPGFLEGNIAAMDSDELVLGYFEIASLNVERYFFNYTDFFPDRPLPPYVINCEPISNPQLISFAPHVGSDFVADEGIAVSPLLNGILSGQIAYFATNEEYDELTGIQLNNDQLGGFPFFVKLTECIDCRTLGSNVKPDFWVE